MLIGNLPLDVTSDELFDLLQEIGEVRSIDILQDSRGRNKGFAIVSLANDKLQKQALSALQNYEFKGRILTVSEANLDRKNSTKSFWSELFRFSK